MEQSANSQILLKSEIQALQQIVHQNKGVIEPLKVLGLPSTATTETIRQVYKNKSLLFHPDRNDNHPGAAEAFGYISNAYQLLAYPATDKPPSPKAPYTTKGYRQYDKLCEELLKRFSEESEEGNNRKRIREDLDNDFSHLTTTQAIRSFIDHQTVLPIPPVHKRKRHKPKSLSFNNLQPPTEPTEQKQDTPETLPENLPPSPPLKTSTLQSEQQTIKVMKIPWLID
jgi:curved DNA-binding protein CbpA